MAVDFYHFFLKRVVVLFAFENITADRWCAAQMNVSPLSPPLHSLFLLLSAHHVDTALATDPANIGNKHSMRRRTTAAALEMFRNIRESLQMQKLLRSTQTLPDVVHV